jgi:ABC-type Zn uptake system ZnuABC Zn-binding protein ZnuA
MRRIVPAIALLSASLTACGGGADLSPTTTGPTQRVKVVATTAQIADFARNVGGDRVEVTQLLAAGVDPHEYDPTPSAISAVSKAAVVLRSGIGLDDWTASLVKDAGTSVPVVVVTEGVGVAAGDPHVWMNPQLADAMVENIRTALVDADPRGLSTYARNAGGYSDSLRRLDRDLRKLIGTVPKKQRLLVTSHQDFGYFAERYGIRIVGTVIPSSSTSAEPSARDLADLVATMRENRVRVVFPEASTDPALEASVASDAGATLGQGLLADTLGPTDGPAGTYIGMMRQNATRMVAGFLGK